MTFQILGPDRLVLYLAPGDLQAKGLEPLALGPPQAAGLVRTACRDAGIRPPDPLEIETFPAPAGVLIFAKPALVPTVLSFPCLSALLDGLSRLSVPPSKARVTRTLWDVRLHCTGLSREAQAVLSEYASPVTEAEEEDQIMLDTAGVAALHRLLST